MRNKRVFGVARTFMVGLGVCLLTAQSLPATALAQQQNVNTGGSGTGLKVSPVRTEMVIEPGGSQSFKVTVENVSNDGMTFKVYINDFVVNDKNEAGQPSLLMNKDEEAPSHSLKRYVSSVPDVFIPSNGTKTVDVTINMPQGVAAGGYYGAVRFAPADQASGKNVTLSASVASLMLVKVPGNIEEKLKISSFDVRSGENATSASVLFASPKNLYATTRLTNEGNVHVQPFGKLTLKKGDKVLQSIEINNTQPRGNVLPDSTRKFTDKLDKASGWGKYTLEADLGYGTTAGGQLTAKATFYVLPVLPLVIILAALFAAVVLFIVRRKKTEPQTAGRPSRRS